MVDNVANFKRVSIDGGFSGSSTTVGLVAGQGSKLAELDASPYNMVVFNATDYSSPDQDPNVSIVRVTSRSADELTIQQPASANYFNGEGSGNVATSHNEAGKAYQGIVSFTKHTYDELVELAQQAQTDAAAATAAATVSATSATAAQSTADDNATDITAVSNRVTTVEASITSQDALLVTQGNEITALQTLVASDDSDLDTVQKIVDFIKAGEFGTSGVTVTNDTTDNSISVNQNGNVGSNAAIDGAIHIENTGNTGLGLAVYSNIGNNADAPLVKVQAANTAFDQDVLQIVNAGTANGMRIISTNTPGANFAAFYLAINADLTSSSRYGQRIYTNADHTSGTLLDITNDNTSANCVVLKLQNDGSNECLFIDNNGNGAALRIDQSGNGGHFRLTGDTSNSGSVDGEIWFDGSELKMNVGGTVFNLVRAAA